MIGLLALLVLAVDLSSVYSLQQMERSTADAAALAGAQDLQTPGSRAVGTSDYVNARTHALANLASKLGATSAPSCSTAADIVNCQVPGTPYQVSIKTPSPSAIDVLATRAVQVTVRQPNVRLTVAQLFGQNNWNVAETSVAGLAFGGQYALITLRPPVSGRTGNQGDILINGTNSAVVAINGDIGMNTGATLNGHSASVSVVDGYYIRYYGATTDTSTPPGPAAYKQLRALIPDPNYPLPARGVVAGAIDTSPYCTTQISMAEANGYPTPKVPYTCYTPGNYTSSSFPTISNGSAVLLEPGLYFFDGGILNQGILIGGYTPNAAGVALVIPQSQVFKSDGGGGRSANILALNRGTAYDLRVGGQEATAALAGLIPVQTNTTPPITMSVIVPRDPPCVVIVPAPNCSASTIVWTGSGNATVTSVAGVVYGPSDNSKVSGNSDPKGYLGQLTSWTITYSGGSTLNENYLGTAGGGVLRLDTACSGGTTPCTP
jgi:hypothetical protein